MREVELTGGGTPSPTLPRCAGEEVRREDPYSRAAAEEDVWPEDSLSRAAGEGWGGGLSSGIHFAGTASTRRLFSVSSRYSSCHSLGPLVGVTCTAVTLYSGQFVAQSE